MAVVIAAIFYFINGASNKKQIQRVSTVNYTTGLTGSCRGVPKFIVPLNMRTPALDSRQQDGAMGLQIRDYSQRDKVWQNPSWKIMGYIGTFERDRSGNIYVFPMPYVSLIKNPPEKQNQLYVIDSETAKVALFMKLPSDDIPKYKKPFWSNGFVL